VLFGDLARFVTAAHERRDTDVEHRSLAFLDWALREGDPDVENLVAVSFVENVDQQEHGGFIAMWPDAPTRRGEANQSVWIILPSVGLSLRIPGLIASLVVRTLQAEDDRGAGP
jgi:hypothetical protein